MISGCLVVVFVLGCALGDALLGPSFGAVSVWAAVGPRAQLLCLFVVVLLSSLSFSSR